MVLLKYHGGAEDGTNKRHRHPRKRAVGDGGRRARRRGASGQTDTWLVEGDEPLVSFFVVCGPIEYFGANGEIVSRDTAAAKAEIYCRNCAENGLFPVALSR